jgi:hypothetical protein
MNDVNEASNRESAALDIMKVREGDSGCNSDHRSSSHVVAVDRKKSLFLVVYDFHYNHIKDECGDSKDDGSGGKNNPGQAGTSAKKVVSGTGTSASCSGTRQENNNMYQEIFLSKLLYDVPVIEDVDTDIVMAPADCLVDGLEFPAASSSGSIYPPPTAIAAPTGGGVTYDASSVNVTFSAVNGGISMSSFPSTSDSSPPVVIKVSRESKKDSCGGSHKTSLDSVSSCQITKRHDPVVVQCVALPDVYKGMRNLSILGIHPTKDGGHLLVVLGSADCDSNDSYNSVSGYHTATSVPPNSNYEGNMMFECSDNDSDMDIDVEDVVGNLGLATNVKSTSITEGKPVEQHPSRQNFGFFHDGDIFQEGLKMLDSSDCKRTDVSASKRSVLLVYSLNFEGEVVKLDETPVKVREFSVYGECPMEVTLLPLLEKEDNGDSSSSLLTPVKGCPQGMAVLVCRDGVVRIIDLATLKTVSQAVPEKKGMKFVSATYCNSE